MRVSYLEYECFKYLIIISKLYRLYMTFYTVILLISLVHINHVQFFTAKALIGGGGGGAYSSICIQLDQCFQVDFEPIMEFYFHMQEI